MRRMSFAMTTAQFLNGSKDVTRRLGWKNLKPGTLLLGVDKVMGFPKGHRGGGNILGTIEVVKVTRESLSLLTTGEVAREGFPGKSPEWFRGMFCSAMRCMSDAVVTRIEFRHLVEES